MEVNRLIGLQREARAAGWTADWTRNDEEALLAGCWFDEAAAHAPIDFIETFCFGYEGQWAGKPIELLDWQIVDVFIPAFGWFREDGTRRYRKAYITVAKKNGKSTMCAVLQIYFLISDGESAAEIYSAATAREQIKKSVHMTAENIIRNSPFLRDRCRILGNTHKIMFGNASWIQALSSDKKGAEGPKTFVLVADEFHVWSDDEFWNALRWGMAHRRQPFTWIITTRGDDQDSVCGIEDEYAIKVKKGEIVNIEYLPVVYGSDAEGKEKVDPMSDEAIRLANPSLGQILRIEELRAERQEAKDKGPKQFAAFQRYRLNQWIHSERPYLDAAIWKESELQLAA